MTREDAERKYGDARMLDLTQDEVNQLYRELPEHVRPKQIQDKVTELLARRSDAPTTEV